MAKPEESSKKKKKKSKKKSSREEPMPAADDEHDAPCAPKRSRSNDDDDDPKREERRAKKARKQKAKLERLNSLPKVDADGIPFTKIQIRRMLRRVKNGLDPIPTEEEEREIREREMREKKEEERLYSAEAEADGSDGDAPGVGGEAEVKSADPSGGGQPAGEEEEDKPSVEQDHATRLAGLIEQYMRDGPPPKKQPTSAKSSKPVPDDYVCQACGNALVPYLGPHMIYDCPMKQTKRGCNQIAKRLRGLNAPSDHKVFVSGLPFDCTESKVKLYFEESAKALQVVHVKLLKFDDSKRCKGQAFVTLDSSDGARAAMGLSGQSWREVDEPGAKGKSRGKSNKKGDGDDANNAGKELKLKISKVLSRTLTKKGKGGKGKK